MTRVFKASMALQTVVTYMYTCLWRFTISKLWKDSGFRKIDQNHKIDFIRDIERLLNVSFGIKELA